MRRRDFSNHLDKSTIPGMTGGKTGDGSKPLKKSSFGKGKR